MGCPHCHKMMSPGPGNLGEQGCLILTPEAAVGVRRAAQAQIHGSLLWRLQWWEGGAWRFHGASNGVLPFPFLPTRLSMCCLLWLLQSCALHNRTVSITHDAVSALPRVTGSTGSVGSLKLVIVWAELCVACGQSGVSGR